MFRKEQCKEMRKIKHGSFGRKEGDSGKGKSAQVSKVKQNKFNSNK